MKTKEGLDALKNEVEAMNAKPAELSRDELVLVTGGAYGGGVCGPDNNSILDRIWIEFYAWLDAHPNATNPDICKILNEKKAAYADELTVDELYVLDEFLNLFAS